MEFVNVKKLVTMYPNLHNFMFVGKRGCGKSYSPEVYCLEDAIYNDRLFVYTGRYKDDARPSVVTQAFKHLTVPSVHTGTIALKEIMKRHPEYNYPEYDIEARNDSLYLVGIDGNERVRLKVVGSYTSIRKAEQFKRGTYPNTYNIFFDEFITKGPYILGRGEPTEFKKIINTVARGSKDYRVFMAGNPDNEIEMNPYIESFNLVYDDIEPGSMLFYDNGNTVFIKLAGNDGFEYINKTTETLFGTSDKSSHTGEVDRPEVPKITDEIATGFTPIFCIRVETATIAIDGVYPYRRCFYIYIGTFGANIITLVTHHRRFNCSMEMTSKYDKMEMLPNPYEFYRFETPAYLASVRRYLTESLSAGRVYYESDRVANILSNLLG